MNICVMQSPATRYVKKIFMDRGSSRTFIFILVSDLFPRRAEETRKSGKKDVTQKLVDIYISSALHRRLIVF